MWHIYCLLQDYATYHSLMLLVANVADPDPAGLGVIFFSASVSGLESLQTSKSGNKAFSGSNYLQTSRKLPKIYIHWIGKHF